MCCGQVCGMRLSLVVEPLATNCAWRIYQRTHLHTKKTSRKTNTKKRFEHWQNEDEEEEEEDEKIQHKVDSNNSRWFFIPHKFIFDFCLTWLLIAGDQAHTHAHKGTLVHSSINQQLNFYYLAHFSRTLFSWNQEFKEPEYHHISLSLSNASRSPIQIHIDDDLTVPYCHSSQHKWNWNRNWCMALAWTQLIEYFIKLIEFLFEQYEHNYAREQQRPLRVFFFSFNISSKKSAHTA